MAKSFKNLFGKITSFENLLLAAKKARKNKTQRQDVREFHLNMEQELVQIQTELATNTYMPLPYRSFKIYEPKERTISAAPYRDRIVHHAICNVIEPLLDKTLVFDTYANRNSKGVHAAIKRVQHYLKQYRYYLKTDIQKYFPSIDHLVLKQTIKRKIGCVRTLSLIDKIIDNSNEQEWTGNIFTGDDLFTQVERKKGLPIGNLTSQIFANYYLNPLDHFIKEELKLPGYVRYMDDFVLFHNEKEFLKTALPSIVQFMNKYRVVLHPNKTFIRPSKNGIVFCGQQVSLSCRKLVSENVRRFRKRITRQSEMFLSKQLSTEKFECSLNGWLGHAKQADTLGLQNNIFGMLKSTGLPLVVYPSGSWRLME